MQPGRGNRVRRCGTWKNVLDVQRCTQKIYERSGCGTTISIFLRASANFQHGFKTFSWQGSFTLRPSTLRTRNANDLNRKATLVVGLGNGNII